jgi:chromosome segregation ATPase
MTLEERLNSLKEAFTGKTAEVEAKASEVASLSAKVEEMTAAMSAKDASLADFTAKVTDLSAKLAAADELRAKAEAQAASITASQESAAKKAAHIAASVGVQPLEVTPSEVAAASKSDAEISEEWVALKQKDAKQASDFYSKNRPAILRAAGLR